MEKDTHLHATNFQVPWGVIAVHQYVGFETWWALFLVPCLDMFGILGYTFSVTIWNSRPPRAHQTELGNSLASRNPINLLKPAEIVLFALWKFSKDTKHDALLKVTRGNLVFLC